MTSPDRVAEIKARVEAATEEHAERIHQLWSDHFADHLKAIGIDPKSFDWSPRETEEETIGGIFGKVLDRIAAMSEKQVRDVKALTELPDRYLQENTSLRQQLSAAQQRAEAAEENNRRLVRMNNDLACFEDSKECLLSIGRVIGCNHVDDPDGRRALVLCVEQTLTAVREERDAAEAVANAANAAEAQQEKIITSLRTGLETIVNIHKNYNVGEPHRLSACQRLAADLLKTFGHAAEIAALREASEKVVEAFEYYKKMGPICRFENAAMIHASTLEELADEARAALARAEGGK